ncbi:MAG TPA: 50S ribosomal protein L29 [Bacilli bacterium]|jgi:large subunit ribosomal protein L29|nr:50S ribosomal protein L29 [Bacilli bacterium]NLT01168.1 50S ribosomal protein L29 [Acholeplasmataceae bacterium]HNZ77422.1 50S ribosomal protein L29 [Bacilli bacterium]HOD61591.1 50S ribosomal protein L29 [Bacilli bacterium]HOE06494.1 50S ribosomal protein L29 [Bacilli bacterium]
MAKKKQKVVAPVVRESEVDKLRKLDDATIEEKIKEMKQELFNLRFQAAVGKLENTAQIGKTKKQIARMKTILTERVNGAK